MATLPTLQYGWNFYFVYFLTCRSEIAVFSLDENKTYFVKKSTSGLLITTVFVCAVSFLS
jgi:hypothetical protein